MTRFPDFLPGGYGWTIIQKDGKFWCLRGDNKEVRVITETAYNGKILVKNKTSR